MTFQYDDGGRKASGYKGLGGDCVCRSIAIITGLKYKTVYDRLADGNATQRRSKHHGKGWYTAEEGILTTRQWFKDYMKELGFVWVATMHIGSGCKVHLHDGELPDGRLVVAVSKHYTAVIDQVIHDIYDPRREINWSDSRGQTGVWRRCVYGYWIFKP